MKDQLTELIVQKLIENKEQLKKEFSRTHPIQVARHFALDNLLPTEIAEQIYANFPKPNKMRPLSSYGECKLKFVPLKKTSDLLQELTAAIQDEKVIAVIEEITGIEKQIPDPAPNAGGITALVKGNFINPHLDNSHDAGGKQYRTVNLLYYVSPDWKEENGGNFELWDEAVKNAIVVPSLFNRLVVMETNRKSWHAVNPVQVDAPRCCVFNYFFSELSPEHEDYFHTTSFNARPEHPFQRMIASIKNAIKAGVQKVAPAR